jgi:hypothetical protein
MLVGDLLAYIDIFSVLFLLGVLSRATTILFVMKQAAARTAALVDSLVQRVRLDGRHSRERGATARPRCKPDHPEDESFRHGMGSGRDRLTLPLTCSESSRI